MNADLKGVFYFLVGGIHLEGVEVARSPWFEPCTVRWLVQSNNPCDQDYSFEMDTPIPRIESLADECHVTQGQYREKRIRTASAARILHREAHGKSRSSPVQASKEVGLWGGTG